MSGAVAFLAGLGTGYLNERDKRTEQARIDERERRRAAREDAADARATEIYDFTKSERLQQSADRAMLREAAKPVSVVPEATMPETMDARDIGQPGESAVPVTGYKVGASRFASQGLADAEAGRQRDTRLAAALDQVDPMGAQSRRTAGIQGQAAQLQLNEAQQAAAAREWTKKAAAAIVQSGSWDAATKFMTESKADGLDGSSQWGHQVSPDGKTVSVYPKGPDGAPLGKGFTLPNDEKGRLQLLATLDQSTPVLAKLADIRAQENAASQRADREADNTLARERFDRQMKLQEDQFKANRQHQVTMEGISRATAAAKAAPQGLSMADLKDGHKTIASTMNADYKEQIAAVMDPAAAAPLKKQRDEEIDKAQRLYTGAMMSGMTLTGEQAVFALRNGKVRQATVPAKDGSGMHTVEVVEIAGRIIPLAPNIGYAAPPSAAPEVKKDTAKPTTATAARLATQGVIAPPSDPMAGMSFEQRRQSITARTAAMDADKDLQALDASMKQALQAGKAANANAINQQIKQLRAQRYGL
jgi:hypothetical protein